MDRSLYQYVVLALLIAVASGLALYRYHAARSRFKPYLVVPLTGDVRVATLEPGGDTRINVNAATFAELEALPGVSSSIAARIIALRPLEDLAELSQVHGIGEKRLALLTELLYCGLVTNQAHASSHE